MSVRRKLPPPYFLLRPQPSVGNLPASLAINSAVVTPELYYNAFDAAAASWASRGYGPTLTAVGTPTASQGSPFLGSVDAAVHCAAANYYGDTGTTTGDLGTEDAILEAVYLPSGTGAAILAKLNASPKGWQLHGLIAGNGARLYVDDGAGHTATCYAGLNVLETYVHVFFVLKRSSATGMFGLLNGVKGTAVNPTAVGSLTNSVGFAINGNSYGGGGGGTARLIHLAMWKGASMIGTEAEAETIGKTRFAQLLGLYPSFAKGTDLPTTVSRAGAAYLDKTEGSSRKLYYVGSNWVRTCKRTDGNGMTDSGILIEPTATNIALQSDSLDTTWTRNGVSAMARGTVDAPNGSKMWLLVADATDVEKCIYQSVTPGTAARFSISADYKADTCTWALLDCYRVAAPTTRWQAWFNLSTGAKGSSTGSPTEYHVDDMGGGIYRCHLTVTLSTTDAYYIMIGMAPSDGTQNGPSCGTANVGCVQAALDSYPSSYIPTTTGSVARATDSLIYNGDNMPVTKGRVRTRVLRESHTPAAASYLLNSDDGTANERHSMLLTTGKKVEGTCVDGGTPQADLTSAGDLSDGAWHTIEYGYAANMVTLKRDGTPETPDTSATMPAQATNLRVGAYSTGGSEFGGLINKLEVYSK